MDNKFYVSYETARKLKLAGYPQSTDTWYYEDGHGVRVRNSQRLGFECIARPAYCEVLDWLDGKSIYIRITHYVDAIILWTFEVYEFDEPVKRAIGFESREDAMEHAIKYLTEYYQ